MGLLRLNTDGSLDSSFGTGGKVITDFAGTNDSAQDLSVLADGKIVVVGNSSGDFMLLRYRSDGFLDSDFGIGGLVRTDFSTGNDAGHAFAIQSDDKLVVVGNTANDFAVARYFPDGILDDSFGTNGRVITDFTGSFDGAWGVAIQGDGKIVVAGQVGAGTGNDNFGVARYLGDAPISTNTPPVAHDDAPSTDEDHGVTFDVLANDTDEQNNIVPSLTVNLTSPANGVLTNNGDGTFRFDPNGQFEYLEVGETAAVSFNYQVFDALGASDIGTVTITVRGVNDRPSVAVNAGSVAVDEGQTAANRGSFADIDVSDVVTLSASVGSVTKHADGTWDWSYVAVEGPGDSQAVVITADDRHGGVSTARFNLTVRNVAPTLTSVVSTAPVACSGSADGRVTVSGSFTDPGLMDTHSVLVSWGDGSSPEAVAVNQNQNTFRGSHRYTAGGIYSVAVTAIDDEGAASAVRTTSAVVQGAGLIDDTLYIIGSEGRDHVEVQQKKGNVNIDLERNQGGSDGESDGGSDHIKRSYAAANVQEIVAILCGGNDHYNDSGDDSSSAIPAIVLGGDGDDVLQGGNGATVLVGGAGRDTLQGRGGNDVLIGGTGKDDLKGGDGDDLLISGSTAFDDNLSMLRDIRNAWNNGTSYNARVAVLSNTLRSGVTVFGDADKDDLSGDKGRDWFFASLDDKVKDRKGDELFNVL